MLATLSVLLLFPSGHATLGFQRGCGAFKPRPAYLSGFLARLPQVANFRGSARIFPGDVVSKQLTLSETSFPAIFMP